MRVLIHGHVTADHLATAEEFFGITPTSWVFNDRNKAPEPHLPFNLMPIDKKLGMLGEEARNYTLVQNADAAIIVGYNPHLAKIVTTYGLPLMVEDEV